MPRTYRMPPLPTGQDISSLMREDQGGDELTPTTPVLILHRGRHVILDKFDGVDYVIPPGYHTCAFGMAQHFQRRAVVPGTRLPTPTITQQSYIAIVGLDDPALCRPFTDEECERYGAHAEALNRDAMLPGDGRRVTYQSTGFDAAHAAALGASAPRGPQFDVQASEEARLRAAHALTPPAESEAQRDARAARAGDDADDDGEEPTPAEASASGRRAARRRK